MTEAKWLACTDPQKMLEFLRGKVSGRRLRLFAVACCRRTWDLLNDERYRKAVETSERFADGVATRQELRDAHAFIDAICALAADGHFDDVVVYYCLTAVCDATAEQPDFASSCCWNAHQAIYRQAEDRSGVAEAESGRQCDFLHDIFGNPFRPVTVEPRWRTPGLVALARTIYEGRTFDRMPVLADALEEAGCSDTDILAHCREPGEHVRGCWVLDRLLGRE